MESLGQRDTTVVAVGEDVVSPVKVRLNQMQDDTSRLGKRGELLIRLIQCLSTCVQQYVEKVSIAAVGKGKSLDTPLHRLFWHILLPSKSSSKMNHCFIYSQASLWNIVGLKPRQHHLQKHSDFIDALGWRDCAMAHMQHPEDEHKAIPWHHPGEERDLSNPGRLPVILNCRNSDDSHVDNYGQESLELGDGNGSPLQEATSLFEFAFSSQLLNPCRCVAVKGNVYYVEYLCDCIHA